MDLNGRTYHWTARDKWLYGLSLAPFLVMFIGALLLLGTYSIWLSAALLGSYLLINLFQAGCCVGCPYRGRYCPALCGIYLGNLFSGWLYPKREFNQAFFDRNAAGGEIMVLVTMLFPVYWLARTAWWLVPVYFLLLAAHLVTFMPTQCEKCSYHDTCPGGIAWRACAVWLEEELG